MKRLFFACFWLLATGSVAFGDKWKLDTEVKDTEYKFGDVRVVLHYDTTKDQYFPEYTLRVYQKDKLAAEQKGVGFEQVFASPDNSFFVGVSNRGLIKDAYVIFDRQGKILKRQPHDPEKVHYKSFSVTLVREWCDVKKPEAKFEVADGILRDVTINGADGERVADGQALRPIHPVERQVAVVDLEHEQAQRRGVDAAAGLLADVHRGPTPATAPWVLCVATRSSRSLSFHAFQGLPCMWYMTCVRVIPVVARIDVRLGRCLSR